MAINLKIGSFPQSFAIRTVFPEQQKTESSNSISPQEDNSKSVHQVEEFHASAAHLGDCSMRIYMSGQQTWFAAKSQVAIVDYPIVGDIPLISPLISHDSLIKSPCLRVSTIHVHSPWVSHCPVKSRHYHIPTLIPMKSPFLRLSIASTVVLCGLHIDNHAVHSTEHSLKTSENSAGIAWNLAILGSTAPKKAGKPIQMMGFSWFSASILACGSITCVCLWEPPGWHISTHISFSTTPYWSQYRHQSTLHQAGSHSGFVREIWMRKAHLHMGMFEERDIH